MRVLDAIRRELDDADVAALEVRHVRVTPFAVAGSVVSVPLAPERLRLLAARWAHGGGLVADEDLARYWREVLVHPKDFHEMLLDARGFRSQAVTLTRVLGLPIVR